MKKSTLSPVWPGDVAPAERLIGAMRLTLSLLSLWFVLFAFDGRPQQARLLTMTLLVYALHSALILGWTMRCRHLPSRVGVLLPWGDLFYCSLLVVWSGGADSVFFGWYLFAVITASYQWGFLSGMCVAMAATLSFAGSVLLSASAMPQMLISHELLLRPLLLLLLGYLIARWGEHELRMKSRLQLLQEITQLANPHFGITHAVGAVMRRLCDFYKAERCWLITYDPFSGEYCRRRVESGGNDHEVLDEVLEGDVARPLLAIPAHWMLMRRNRREGLRAVDYASGQAIEASLELESVRRSLPPLLADNSFVSLPVQCRGEARGRLFVATRRYSLRWDDAELLRQIVEQVVPVVENVRLVDRLATYAAQGERGLAAPGFSESLLQCCDTLQRGLLALHAKIAPGEAQFGKQLTADVEQLLELSNGSLKLLQRAREGEGRTESELVAAVRYGAAKFTEESGIQITIEADDDLSVSERLAAEAFFLIAEGLSNIRLHTRARRGRVALRGSPQHLWLCIENENALPPGATSHETAGFTPRSIEARAGALGGSVRVEQTASSTSIHIELPRAGLSSAAGEIVNYKRVGGAPPLSSSA